MPNENLISTLEQSLRQTRATRARLAGRLAEIEAEAETLRSELSEMDALANQTEGSIYRLLSSVLSGSSSSGGGASNNQQGNITTPTDAELEAALRQDAVKNNLAAHGHQSRVAPITHNNSPIAHTIPAVRNDTEVISDRFYDRTIPQATTMLLREANEPLHVNEIYNRLLEGGFNFTGHNPTISIAVSLNRNSRFRKVAPGTFDLVMRDASQAV
ncbi:MAG: hypothetical protein ACR2LC_08910 [Pyrinomonadaceae bacterium]